MLELRGDFLVIHVSKELDHHVASQIREEIDRCILQNKIKNIIFDFQETMFMDSSGIGVIMGRYKLIQEFGGKIAVLNAGRAIQKILLYSGLTKITKQFQNMDDAVEYFQKGSME